MHIFIHSYIRIPPVPYIRMPFIWYIQVSPTHGLQTNVLYFSPPDEDFPSLVRSTTFTNLNSKPLELEVGYYIYSLHLYIPHLINTAHQANSLIHYSLIHHRFLTDWLS